MKAGKRILESNYWVTIDGFVWSEKNKKYLKPYKDKDGYSIIDLFIDKKRVTKKLHRLVAEMFIPNPSELKEVNHIDGDKSNNTMFNLEWCCRSSNMKHAFKKGLLSVKYNPVYDVSTGKFYNSTKEASEMLGINYGTLKNYLSGRINNKTSLRKII